MSLDLARKMLRQEKDYLSEIMNYAAKARLPRPSATHSRSFSIEDILLKGNSPVQSDKPVAAELDAAALASYLPLTMPPHYPAAALPAYACKLMFDVQVIDDRITWPYLFQICNYNFELVSDPLPSH